jgi:hypothetical protein
MVLGLWKALNDENYEAARRYGSDNMKYVGPLRFPRCSDLSSGEAGFSSVTFRIARYSGAIGKC